MQRIAIIDLGSNSARLIVMHIYENGAYNLIYHQKEGVRLSEGTTGENTLRPEAISRAISALKTFSHMCSLLKVDKVLAVATAAVRNATNGQEFVKLALEQTGIPLRIVSGEEEAKLGFIGVINSVDINDALLFDLGGGSTELTLIRNRRIEQSVSLPFGAVNLTEKFSTQDKVSENQLTELKIFINQKLDAYPWLKDIGLPIIGIGGTARNIAKMDQRRKNYPFPKLHNYRLGVYSLEDLWKSIVRTSVNQRGKIPGLSSERADLIVAGTTIVKCLFDATRSPNLIISGCGIREGLFLEQYRNQEQQDVVIDDILTHSAHNILLFYNGNSLHAEHVALLTTAMFDGWQELHKMGPRDRTLLQIVSLLHDIGITINYYDHPRHSAYLIENARLFGLTHREQMLLAVVAGWHHGQSAKYVRNKIYSEFLDEADWQKARKMALLLALAESLDTTQAGLIERLDAGLKDGKAYLGLLPNTIPVIEKQAAEKHSRWFKKEFGQELKIEIP
ncbi:ppx/gppa phosphatase [Lucifera butyrica]|uniref:Chaperone protein DnaK n=1 Tax=Lucifera butyrica TaxID=1351585 RepID=A0A498R627_9FIRM|nr:exopolyphosphatase [Lucifera butyrica]VBB06914.1 ppx/gppa phosphatase [Lucifera butyrica]